MGQGSASQHLMMTAAPPAAAVGVREVGVREVGVIAAVTTAVTVTAVTVTAVVATAVMAKAVMATAVTTVTERVHREVCRRGSMQQMGCLQCVCRTGLDWGTQHARAQSFTL